MKKILITLLFFITAALPLNSVHAINIEISEKDPGTDSHVNVSIKKQSNIRSISENDSDENTHNTVDVDCDTGGNSISNQDNGGTVSQGECHSSITITTEGNNSVVTTSSSPTPSPSPSPIQSTAPQTEQSQEPSPSPTPEVSPSPEATQTATTDENEHEESFLDTYIENTLMVNGFPQIMLVVDFLQNIF